MTISHYQASIPAFVHGLQQLSHLLEKAGAHAQSQGLEASSLIDARLAPDMFPLSAQVQRASDTAKLSAKRLSDLPAPSMEDNETTFDALQARIRATIDYLQSIPSDALDADRRITLKFGSLQAHFDSARYIAEFALPNFYFHITAAYAILRNQGVAIGKLDYLGRIGEVEPA
ncbi:MAG TPA: DUF1993 domain-containing protein [Stenotrophomonas sp.]|jgi:hypothetical protein